MGISPKPPHKSLDAKWWQLLQLTKQKPEHITQWNNSFHTLAASLHNHKSSNPWKDATKCFNLVKLLTQTNKGELDEKCLEGGLIIVNHLWNG